MHIQKQSKIRHVIGTVLRRLCAMLLVLAAADEGRAAEKIVIATEGAYPPFSWVDSAGKLQGFDVDIANALCAQLQATCEIVAQKWDDMIPNLVKKKYDAVVASMSSTQERRQVVDFTINYYYESQVLLARTGASHDVTAESLNEKSIGVVGPVVVIQGVTRRPVHELYLEDKFDDVDVDIYDSIADALEDLTEGDIDAIFGNSIDLYREVLLPDAGKRFAFVGRRISDPQYFPDGAAIAVRKGDGKLRDALNDALQAIHESGTYLRIQEKYFPPQQLGDLFAPPK
ncbi:MAG: transporter substrate-binding domain-containing protein [Aestuariivirga sp.]